jgi:hypothetical protein
MNELQITRRLHELAEALNSLLRSSSRGTKNDGVYVSSPRSREDDPEELLQEISLQVKYLMFDLEATRRENRYLRQILENRSRPPEDPKDGPADPG